MGETDARAAGLDPLGVGAVGEVTTAADTRALAAEIAESGVDLLLFAGGDGTAVDILAAVGDRMPVLGIPAGVKMHSAVFAREPARARASSRRASRPRGPRPWCRCRGHGRRRGRPARRVGRRRACTGILRVPVATGTVSRAARHAAAAERGGGSGAHRARTSSTPCSTTGSASSARERRPASLMAALGLRQDARSASTSSGRPDPRRGRRRRGGGCWSSRRPMR